MAGVMVPLRVRARLATGVAQAAPWGIALDGLLASVLWEQHKAQTVGYERAMDSTVAPPDLELPLARCELAGPSWHWAASCALPEPGSRVQVRSWTGRVDARALEQMAAGLPKTVSARQGRYRARRMPLLVSVCPAVSWQAVGDPQRIAELLEEVVVIGKKRAMGEGQVLGWQVSPQPDLGVFEAGHLHADGSLGRPVPAVCRAKAGQVPDGGWGRAGLRPPYMHPARQQDLYLPALLDS